MWERGSLICTGKCSSLKACSDRTPPATCEVKKYICSSNMDALSIAQIVGTVRMRKYNQQVQKHSCATEKAEFVSSSSGEVLERC